VTLRASGPGARRSAFPVERRGTPLRALGWLFLWLAVASSALGQEAPALAITFLDVGQGDAVLIRSPEGKTALVDAGPGVDIVPRLRRLGVDTIDLAVASHAHADHIGGMLRVVEGLPVRFYLDNGLAYNGTRTYRTLARALQAHPGILYLQAVPRTITLGSASIEVLALPREDDQNNRSVALVVRYGEFVAWLSGDSEREELSWMLARHAVPDVTLLKAAHHGSANGFTRAFLRAARPEVIVISVGANDYGHPHREAVAAYTATKARLLRTDRDGEVTILGHADGTFEVAP
jgi:beta-lactamase superfamily II metal-dependent hydrolase